MRKLETEYMLLRLREPWDGFYMGTRFDHGGVFDSLIFRGSEMCGRWFPHYDPFMHDAVCGPAEEFSPVFLDGRILKTGVGLLDGGSGEYDRFNLYRILDKGSWEVAEGESSVLFRHTLPGFYTYDKEISLSGPSSFRIRHKLLADLPFRTDVYNHNFFTFGKLEVGPGRKFDFPFAPGGDWRAEYNSVGFTSSGVRFSRCLEEGESVYTGNIHEAGKEGAPYAVEVSDGRLCVIITGSVPSSRMVLWANHRIACMEPYNPVIAVPGQPLEWWIDYQIVCK